MTMRTTLWIFAGALLVAGCSGQALKESPFPPQVPITTNRMTVQKVYEASEPAAVLKFDHDASGNPTQGTIVGRIHGWPFPYGDPSGDTGEGLFTYTTDLTVTRYANDKLPEAARGTRTVYFNASRPPLSLEDPGAFGSGTPIIRDSVYMQFAFDNKERLEITVTLRQVSAQPFEWKGETVTPPGEPPDTKVMTARYSPHYDGYVVQ